MNVQVHSIGYLATCRKCGTEQTFKAEVNTPLDGLDADLAVQESLEAEGFTNGFCRTCAEEEYSSKDDDQYNDYVESNLP